MNKELKIKAINDFNEIKAIVDAHKNDDLGVLCELLGGHNFDGDLFDLNFKYSFEIMYNEDYINKIIDKFDFKNQDTKENVKKIKEELNNYIKLQLKNN